jgi:hypothetical protein
MDNLFILFQIKLFFVFVKKVFMENIVKLLISKLFYHLIKILFYHNRFLFILFKLLIIQNLKDQQHLKLFLLIKI